jgi:hypothetical protein
MGDPMEDRLETLIELQDRIGDWPLRVKNTRSGIGRFAPNRAIVRGDIGGRQELVGEDYK